jgi:hypothetical protein
VPGRAGIGGPYSSSYGIVFGPNASGVGIPKWGNVSHYSPEYVDQIAPFTLPDGRLASFVAEDHLLATADSPAGPWLVERGSEKQGVVAIGTPRSAYNENPVVSTLVLQHRAAQDGNVSAETGTGTGAAGNRTVYVAVFDTVQSEHYGFGLSTSDDGLHWAPGVVRSNRSLSLTRVMMFFFMILSLTNCLAWSRMSLSRVAVEHPLG